VRYGGSVSLSKLLQAVTTCQSQCDLGNRVGEYCAYDNDKGLTDSCQGDSGGPLMYAENGIYYVYGLVSYGIGCSTNEGYYTAVPTYYNWIAKVVTSN
jgi:secreted trypsin-like serine protease